MYLFYQFLCVKDREIRSKGSRVTVFLEEGELIYRVREDMLEVGFFRVSDSYVPWYDAEPVEILDHEAFQPGQVESGSY